jgi:hypothetical protein
VYRPEILLALNAGLALAFYVSGAAADGEPFGALVPLATQVCPPLARVWPSRPLQRDAGLACPAILRPLLTSPLNPSLSQDSCNPNASWWAAAT